MLKICGNLGEPEGTLMLGERLVGLAVGVRDIVDAFAALRKLRAPWTRTGSSDCSALAAMEVARGAVSEHGVEVSRIETELDVFDHPQLQILNYRRNRLFQTSLMSNNINIKTKLVLIICLFCHGI